MRSLRRVASYLLFEGRPATTRGQFINPVVFAHLRFAAKHRMSPPDRPVFLLGVGRSGTTHLGRLLGVHPDVGFLNEPKAMWHVVDASEDVSGFYNHGPSKFSYGPADAESSSRQRAWNMYSYYSRFIRAPRVVDKYPELTYRGDYLRAIFPKSILIAIVREPAAVVRSIDSWSVSHRRDSEDWWGVEDSKWLQMRREFIEDDPLLKDALDREAPRALIEWIIGMRALVDSPPSAQPDLIVRHEDLQQHPEQAIKKILDVCDLRYDAATIHFAVEETSSQTPVPDMHFGTLTTEVDRLRSALGYPGRATSGPR